MGRGRPEPSVAGGWHARRPAAAWRLSARPVLGLACLLCYGQREAVRQSPASISLGAANHPWGGQRGSWGSGRPHAGGAELGQARQGSGAGGLALPSPTDRCCRGAKAGSGPAPCFGVQERGWEPGQIPRTPCWGHGVPHTDLAISRWTPAPLPLPGPASPTPSPQSQEEARCSPCPPC